MCVHTYIFIYVYVHICIYKNMCTYLGSMDWGTASAPADEKVPFAQGLHSPMPAFPLRFKSLISS